MELNRIYAHGILLNRSFKSCYRTIRVIYSVYVCFREEDEYEESDVPSNKSNDEVSVNENNANQSQTASIGECAINRKHYPLSINVRIFLSKIKYILGI